MITYKIQMKFTNEDGTVNRSLSISDANSNATKEQVTTFGTGTSGYCDAYSEVSILKAANLITTQTTDLLID